jgi:hypothetical protein
VAWYAMRTGVARIGTVARWFGITSSDIRYLIRQHQRKHPQYFSKTLIDLFPDLASQYEPPKLASAPRAVHAKTSKTPSDDDAIWYV